MRRARFAWWVPLATAGLVGCLTRPSSSGAPSDAKANGKDGRTSTDGRTADAPATGGAVCPGAGPTFDAFASGSCGDGTYFGPMAQGSASNGTLTLTPHMGSGTCSWGVTADAAFHGFVVKLDSLLPPTEGQAVVQLAPASGALSLDVGKDGTGNVMVFASGFMSNLTPPTPPPAAPCVRIRISGGAVSGEYFDGSQWQTVGTGPWSTSGQVTVSLGAQGMGGSAVYEGFDHLP